MLTVACVNVGTKYGVEYVERLRTMVENHLSSPHRFVCLTDQPGLYESGKVQALDISRERLSGWWAKLKLFDAGFRAQNGLGQWLYFDLDTVIIRDISPLARWAGSFAICENFTRLAGNLKWPCGYGSCVMSIGQGFGVTLWNEFNRDRDGAIRTSPRGDQQFIEKQYPHALLLQDEMPEDFFIGYRRLTQVKPERASVVVFAGNHKPDNSPFPWVQTAWLGSQTARTS